MKIQIIMLVLLVFMLTACGKQKTPNNQNSWNNGTWNNSTWQ